MSLLQEHDAVICVAMDNILYRWNYWQVKYHIVVKKFGELWTAGNLAERTLVKCYMRLRGHRQCYEIGEKTLANCL